MAKKISQLPTGATLTGTELLEIVQSGTSKRTTAQEIANLAPGAVTGAIAYKGTYDMSITNNYPVGGNSGYLYVTNSSTTRQRNGNPIESGTILFCLTNGASETNDADWLAIYTF